MQRLSIITISITLLFNYSSTNAKTQTNPILKALMAMADLDSRQASSILDMLSRNANPFAQKAAFLKAKAMLEAGKLEKAKKIYSKLANDPDQFIATGARFGLSSCLAKQGKFKQAESEFSEGLAHLSSEQFTEFIAERFERLGDEAMNPADTQKEADPVSAQALFLEALDLQVPKDTTLRLWLKAGQAMTKQGRHSEAARHYMQYLEQEKYKDYPGHTQMTLDAARSLVKSGQMNTARLLLRDLKQKSQKLKIQADASWLMTRTFHLPAPTNPSDLVRGMKALREFIRSFPNDPKIKQARLELATAPMATLGWTALAEEELRKLIAQRGPEDLMAEGMFKLAACLYRQKKYVKAAEAYREYLRKHPSHKYWSDARKGLENSHWQPGVEAMLNKEWEKAAKAFENFAKAHPASQRTPDALQKAADNYIEAKNPDKALSMLKLLTTKFASTRQGWDGLRKTAQILIEKKGQYQKGHRLLLKAVSKDNPFAKTRSYAQALLAEINEKRLLVQAPKNFRSLQQPFITWHTRNIHEVTIRAYRIRARDFFRDRLNMDDLTSVDIALCEPDKTWTVKVKDYKKYIPLEQKIQLPFKRPGVYLLNLIADDLQATTVLRISDLGIIVKHGAGQVFVFAQDRRRLKPLPGTDIIITDGQKIISQGATGGDGTWSTKIDQDLVQDQILAFGAKGDDVAWTDGFDEGASSEQGTQDLAYMFSGRPIYNPGDRVNIAGIYRKSHQGHLGFSSKDPLSLTVTAPGGYTIGSYKLALDKYGTFHQSFSLDDAAVQGPYYYSLNSKIWGQVQTGSFKVIKHSTLAHEIIISLDHDVIMRGDEITGEVRVLHSHGAPAKGMEVLCRLSGGDKVFSARTDEQGRIRFSFPSRKIFSSKKLELTAVLAGKNQFATANVLVASTGFSLSLRPREKTIFAGQPFSLLLSAKRPDGKAVSAKVHLRALSLRNNLRGEVKLWSKDVQIPESGSRTVNVSIPTPGTVIVRASSTDEFGNALVTERALELVGKKEPGIWFKVKGDEQLVNKPMELDVYSRLDKALVLLTCDTDRIWFHRSVLVRKGRNSFSIPLDEALAPNFLVTASAMHEQQIFQTSQEVLLNRKLNLEIRSDKKQYEPGDEVALTVIATDVSGKPADARLLISVVDAMLLKQYPQVLPPLMDTFYSKNRLNLFETISSASIRFGQVEAEPIQKADIREAEGSAAMTALKNRRKEMTSAGVETFNGLASGEAVGVGGLGMAGYGSGGGGLGGRRAMSPKIMAGKAMVRGGLNGRWRRNFDETAIFRYDVATGADGIATLRFRLPDAIARWRVATRAVSKDTLLGQSFLELGSFKSFFARLMLPTELEHGDRVQALARVFNYTKAETTASLELSHGGKTASAKIHLAPGSVTEHLFKAVSISENSTGPETFKLIVKAPGHVDKMEKKISTRQRGYSVQTVAEGWTSDEAARTLSMDPEAKPAALQVEISDRLDRFFLGDDLTGLLFGDDPANALVALHIMDLVGPKGDTVSVDLVHKRVSSALLHLQATQKSDGGWGWTRGAYQSNIQATCDALRALSRAKPKEGVLGWVYPKASVARAEHWLEAKLSSLSSDDLTSRSRIIFALAHLGKSHVPKVVLQRLHRLRRTLPLEAKALLGLTWLKMGRAEQARQVAKSIQSNSLLASSTLNRWNWEDALDMSYKGRMRALELLARLHLKNFSTESARSWLKNQSVLDLCTPRSAEATLGLITALEAESNHGLPSRVRIVVNGKDAGELKTSGRTRLTRLAVPLSLLRKGKNKVALKSSTMGSLWFRFTLKGYMNSSAKSLEDKNAKVRISRYIEPVPQDYKGVAIKDGFSVARVQKTWFNDVSSIGMGKKLKVTISMERDMVKPLDHAVVVDRIPPGFQLALDDKTTGITHMAKRGRDLAIYLGNVYKRADISYVLIATNPGSYEFPPPRLRSLVYTDAMIAGSSRAFTILPTENKANKIRPTPDELYNRGMAAAKKKDHTETVRNLETLWDKFDIKPGFSQAVLEKLLFASIHLHDNKRILKYFELAKEKNPSLLIPFEDLAALQQAYRALHVYEGGLHLDRGMAQAMFTKQIKAIGFLESIDQISEATDLLKKFLIMFPQDGLNAKAEYAFSQVIFDRADRITEGEALEGFDRPGLLDLVIDLMADFIGKNPKNPQAPAAIFSIASAMMEKDKPADAVAWCKVGLRHHKDSGLSPALAYLEAFAHFSMGQYKDSLSLCKRVVQEAQNDDHVAMAKYIMAQIYHAQGRIEKALEYYSQVADQFRDAQETIDELKRSWIRIPDLVRVPRGKRAKIKITAYNTRSVDIKVYRVDLMKLYLLKGSLYKLENVNLAGISPIDKKKVNLHAAPEDGTQDRDIALSLPGKGAYLVLVRGAGLVHPSLVLVDALEMGVDELQGEARARVAVRDSSGHPLPGVQVELKGTQNQQFTLGKTDLRGIFIGNDLQGAVTAIAEHKGAYGLYRGKLMLSSADASKDARYRKKSTYDFDDVQIEGEIQKPSGEYLNSYKGELDSNNGDYKGLFNQEVKGMNADQAL